MSGLLGEVATPCPSRSSNGNNTLDSIWEDGLDPFDDTADLEFTTEIKLPDLTNVKPRRRTRAGSPFQIHDDNAGKKSSSLFQAKKETATMLGALSRKSSLLSQPAQRFRRNVSFAPTPPSTNLQQEQKSDSRIEKTRPNPADNNELLMQINGKDEETERHTSLKNDVRRDTVYIPTENTTAASAFRGLLKARTSSTVNSQVLKDVENSSLEALVGRRQAKKSLTTAARRAPLQPSTRIAQKASNEVDVAGKNGGKENTPPGSRLVDNKGKGLGCNLPVYEQLETKKGSSLSNMERGRVEIGKTETARPANVPRRPVLGDRSNANPPLGSSRNKGMIKPKLTTEPTQSNPEKQASSKPMAKSKTNVMSSKVAPSNIKTKKLN